MPRETIWLCFDLGVRGDYESLYSWLDRHSAKECGDSLAWLWYDYSGDLVEELKSDLRQAVALDRRSRIYLLRLMGGRVRGKFLFGNRRSAPWSGYAPSESPEEDTSSGEERDD